MPDQPSLRRRFQFRLRTLLIGVTLLAATCGVLLNRLQLINERDDAQRQADQYKRLSEEWQATVSDPASDLAPPADLTTPRRNSQTNGIVPDARTAIRIALAVWGPIYGDKTIEGERPYVARLNNGVWTVEGSLREGWDGGTAFIQINKVDGKVLKVTHYK